MENNKYYAPDIEDLFVGYECELYQEFFEYDVLVRSGWGKISLIPNSIKYLSEKRDKIGALIRTPYLTKEQIEAEGWVYKGIGLAESRPLLFGKDNLFEIVFYSPDHLVINQFGGTLQYQHRYIGCCPSINEFRKIVKWLGI